MRIKLDENFDVRLIPLISQRGHEIDTVMGEKLTGQPDEAIYRACLRNKQVLLTLDMHFSNPLRFPPDETEGIVVLRLPRPILPLSPAACVHGASGTFEGISTRTTMDCGGGTNPRG
jgi:hypothetical protein